MRFNLPLALTWLRIVAIPLFVAVLYFPEDWLSERTANIVSMLIFIAAAVTDWADGWLARRWNMTTACGAFLDPVADNTGPVGRVLIWVAAAVTLFSMVVYLKAAWDSRQRANP